MWYSGDIDSKQQTLKNIAKDNREVVNIIELNTKITKIVARQQDLRTAIDAVVSDIEGK